MIWTQGTTFRHFYPRPPRGGRPLDTPVCGLFGVISIHALREEGDDLLQVGDVLILEFLSTPSARRATFAFFGIVHQALISIHALREEGDCDRCLEAADAWISIHALREEGDA